MDNDLGDVRLQKWISGLGLASRREAERWILEGRLTVNDRTATLGERIDPSSARVALNGKLLSAEDAPPKVYWMLHKPVNTLTSRARDGDKPRIYDLPKLKKPPFHIFSVGRLDFKTEGLLLLTNDGAMSQRLCLPNYKLPRHYQVLVKGKASAGQLQELRRGVTLEDGLARCEITPAYGVKLGAGRGSWYFVTVHEGRNRLVRRLFEHLNLDVARLVRYGFGDLRLDRTLKSGDYRQLSSPEIRSLKKATSAIQAPAQGRAQPKVSARRN